MLKICAPITQIEAGLFDQLAAKAFDLGADFLEVRFDYTQPSQIESALKLVRPFRAKCIYTLRKGTQGGVFCGSEIERLHHLRSLCNESPMMVDVELETLQENPELGDFLKSVAVPVLVSWHDFKSTPSKNDMSELVSSMGLISKQKKLVTMANSSEDVLNVLDLYGTDKSTNLVAFSMGEIGLISRVLCAITAECPFTYAAIDKPIAPGQITIEQMKRFFRMITNKFSPTRGF